MSERTFIVSIDYSKAFDSVSHIQMFNILNAMEFPRHNIIVALIPALYEKQSAIVRWNGSRRDNRIRRRYCRKINLNLRYAFTLVVASNQWEGKQTSNNNK